MIYDQLKNQHLYRNLHPRIEKAFAYLNQLDPETPDGRIELEGENLVALFQTYETRSRTDKKMESHQRYVDLQYIISGEETLFHQSVDLLQIREPYHAERDVVFYQDADDQSLVLRAGDFAIFFQHDGHKPSCIYQTTQTIRKVVFKISLT
jgi:biofilm protein TabA